MQNADEDCGGGLDIDEFAKALKMAFQQEVSSVNRCYFCRVVEVYFCRIVERKGHHYPYRHVSKNLQSFTYIANTKRLKRYLRYSSTAGKQ